MTYIHEEFTSVKAHRPRVVRRILGHVHRPRSPIFIDEKLHRFYEDLFEVIRGGERGDWLKKHEEWVVALNIESVDINLFNVSS